MFGLLKKLVGSKEKSDAKIYQPYVDKVKTFEASLKNISNDDLRKKTTDFKAKIKAKTSALDNEITELEKKIADNPMMDFQDKDAIYNSIDKIKKKLIRPLNRCLMKFCPKHLQLSKKRRDDFQVQISLK
ncbi:MAG: hypothetical protein IPM77_09800 [Crocinitomicaceae bacterium]|nr:hypothetical protein [Crocinitomicaceae bacterium]